jgi:hypothetical protein
MKCDWDSAVNEIQKGIYENARTQFGDAACELWLHPL